MTERKHVSPQALDASLLPKQRSTSGSKAAGRSPKQIKTSKKRGSPINFNSVQKIGLALPGVEESTAYGLSLIHI